LLNGQSTLEEIIQQLAGQVAADHIHYVLASLQEKGYLTDAAYTLTPEAAAFWSLLGVDPQLVSDRLPHQVFVSAIGAVDAQPLTKSLQALGLAVQPWQQAKPNPDVHSLLVVLTDDYLQPELRQINQKALQTQQPWLLVKPIGGILWFGSIFHPGETGCWECLAQRLRGNREVETSVLQQQKQEKGCLPSVVAGLPSTGQAAIGLITTEIAKWLVKQCVPELTIPTLAGKIITLDQTNFTLKTHTLSQRPQCPTCGAPNLVSEQLNQPIALTSRKKLFTQDGGHRAFTPDQILKRYHTITIQDYPFDLNKVGCV